MRSLCFLCICLQNHKYFYETILLSVCLFVQLLLQGSGKSLCVGQAEPGKYLLSLASTVIFVLDSRETQDYILSHNFGNHATVVAICACICLFQLIISFSLRSVSYH
jgi:hypothetical protein